MVEVLSKGWPSLHESSSGEPNIWARLDAIMFLEESVKYFCERNGQSFVAKESLCRVDDDGSILLLVIGCCLPPQHRLICALGDTIIFH